MPVTLAASTRPPDDIRPTDHVVVSVVRNETLRLPFFLMYYRALGFDRFLLIDNGSSDGTHEFLEDRPDVSLFETQDRYGPAHFGMDWVNPVLNTHCPECWVLIADADELLVWPGSAGKPIQDLTGELDRAQARALFCVLTDCYSDRPFGSVGYVRGEPFLSATPFFDRKHYRWITIPAFPHRMILGGARTRVFDGLGRDAPAGSKLPLVRWQPGQAFDCGAHGLKVPVTLAPMRGALLHCKHFDDAVPRAREEIIRGEHFGDAREYRSMELMLEQTPSRSFFHPDYSTCYTGPDQLLALGLMHARDPFGSEGGWLDP